jgi:XTP/dITP diphosphohydrolase
VIVYCGTSNKGKLREFQLAAPAFELRSVDAPAPEEHGSTFDETAIEKALYYGRHLGADSGEYVFADDSGLEVDALGGAPGVHSARFAGPDATDAANNALLLQKLTALENRAENRNARFVCAIALVRNGELIHTFRGVVEGRIIDDARGPHGFGYDPLFYYEPFGCTFGEASDAQKMSVSHRAQALNAMFAFLREAGDSDKSRSSSWRR